MSGVKLVQAQLYESDLTRATLTGAYIEDWGISVTTKLLQVHCDYIYMKYPTEKEPYSDRRPADKTKNFKPGEFASLVGIVANTVDLVFQYGIDWKAFFEAFTKLQQEYQDVSIQAIEKKPEDTFVIKLNVSEEANKPLIENHVTQLYETNLKLLETKYREKFKSLEAHHQEEIITLYKERGADMKEIAKILASRPIDVEAKAVVEQPTKNVEVEMNFQAPVTGAAGKVEGNQNIYASEQKQTLAQAAEEIQKLLKQLEKTNPTATLEQQKAYVDAAISPTLKQRCVGALKSGGETAIDEFLDNPYVNVGKAVVKGWIKPE